jgi:CheY-like chemotaxis protein
MSSPGAPILIVEDNDETRYVLERILAIKGYPTTSVANAAAALRTLREGKRASMIILDLHMPGMDGRAMLRELRADVRFAKIPVVVFSGDAHEVPDVTACVRKGSDDPDVLLSAIARCLAS